MGDWQVAPMLGVLDVAAAVEHDGDAYFLVNDVDVLAAEFAANGVRFLRELQDEPCGIRDFTIEIPEGHRLTFGAPLP